MDGVGTITQGMILNKYVAYGQIIATDLNFDDTLPKSRSEEISLEIINKPFPQNPRQLTKVYRKGVQARFGGDFNEAILNWDAIVKFKIINGKSIYYQNLGADQGTLKLFTLSEALGIALWQKGIFLFHGSAVKVKNEALIFLGHPGAGKSTTATAFWKNGNIILSDDLTAVQINGNKAYVIPGFPQLKVWKNALVGLGIDNSPLQNAFEGVDKFLIAQPIESFPAEPIVLKKITILKKPKARTKDGVLHSLKAPIELLKHFPIPIQLLKNEQISFHFKMSMQLAKLVEIASIKRPKDFMALTEFVRNTVN